MSDYDTARKLLIERFQKNLEYVISTLDDTASQITSYSLKLELLDATYKQVENGIIPISISNYVVQGSNSISFHPTFFEPDSMIYNFKLNYESIITGRLFLKQNGIVLLCFNVVPYPIPMSCSEIILELKSDCDDQTVPNIKVKLVLKSNILSSVTIPTIDLTNYPSVSKSIESSRNQIKAEHNLELYKALNKLALKYA